jgi:uncharacterized coiled-coil protein SlyX
MSPEQIVTIVTGILQAGGVGVFVYYLIRGLRSRISGLEGTVQAQNETLRVMERRVAETEKVGQIYKDLLSNLPKDLENYKAVISKTRDDMILELQNANKQKDEQLKQIGEIDRSLAEQPQKGAAKRLESMRFLLDTKNEPFRKFVEQLCGDIDVAVDALVRSPDFAELLAREGKALVIEDNKERWDALVKPPEGAGASRMRSASWSVFGWYGFFDDNRIVMSTSQRNLFSAACRTLKIKLAGYEQA